MKIRPALPAVFLCAALLQGGCVRDTPGYCDVHEDCAASEFCSLPAHACAEGARAPVIPPCVTNRDCKDNQICVAPDCVDAVARAALSGSQQLPPTCSLGEASLLLALDDKRGELIYSLNHNLSDVVAAHIHEGALGQGGNIAFTLKGDPAVLDRIPVGSDHLTTLAAGGYYVDLHTQTFTSGEVRGQVWSLLMPSPPLQFGGVLTGLQEAPPVGTRASGRATLSFDERSGDIMYTANHNLDGTVMGIHLHRGAFNVAGPHLIDLETTSQQTIGGTLRRDQVYKESMGAYAVLVKSGLTYFNFHTVARSGGELRAQMLPMVAGQARLPVPFNVLLDGASVVPAVNNGLSQGTAQFFLSEDQTRLTFRLTHTSTGALSAHVHRGMPGQNGVVLCALGTGQDKVQGSCEVKAAPAPGELGRDDLLRGALYVDVHSTTFTDGELRGQVVVPQ